nr:Rne/Rng family ribonuclease [Oceanococcus sp. HetDA_MAG_MS8]
MKRILINATQPEELRLAIVDGQRLLDLDIESQAREQRKGNVYKGRITRVEPSLEACFVDYGEDRQGFLSLREISPEYFEKPAASGDKSNMRELIKEGREIIVQVDKEERGTKGAALTTYISLAGRYLVLMPNNPKAGGVSRRIDGEDRADLREAMSSLELPAGMGAIARTAGVGRTAEELQWDLNYLLDLWQSLLGATHERKAPFLIYQESNIIIRALRDYLKPDIGEIVVDEERIYAHASEFMRMVMPGQQNKLKYYADPTPLFSRYQIESQIESAHVREVRLPSGGSIVIDSTEALTAIDINSARSTRGGSIEETALHTNLEAADEIARQLRLRDLGGLVVIDFIDMNTSKNQREVENRLRDACGMDRARIQLGRISRFGLLEMSRQRLRPSLREHTHLVCPRCDGQGMIRTIESTGLLVLRLLEEEALKEKTGRVIAQLPASVATYLLNEKRSILGAIEARTEVDLTLVANPNLESPQFDISRIREDQLQEENNGGPSHSLIHLPAPNPADLPHADQTVGKKAGQVPAVAAVLPSTPAPTRAEPEPRQRRAPQHAKSRPQQATASVSLLARLWAALLQLTGMGGQSEEQQPRQPNRSNQGSGQRGRGQGRGGDRKSGSGGNQRNRRSNTRRDNRRDRDDITTNRQAPSASSGTKAETNADKPQDAADNGGRKRRRRRRSGNDNNAANEQSGAQNNAAKAAQEGAAPDTTRAPESQADNAGKANHGPTAEGDDGSNAPKSRRRGRRGGRRRRGARGNGADGAEATQSSSTEQSQDGSAPRADRQDTPPQDSKNAEMSQESGKTAKPENSEPSTPVETADQATARAQKPAKPQAQSKTDVGNSSDAAQPESEAAKQTTPQPASAEAAMPTQSKPQEADEAKPSQSKSSEQPKPEAKPKAAPETKPAALDETASEQAATATVQEAPAKPDASDAKAGAAEDAADKPKRSRSRRPRKSAQPKPAADNTEAAADTAATDATPTAPASPAKAAAATEGVAKAEAKSAKAPSRSDDQAQPELVQVSTDPSKVSKAAQAEQPATTPAKKPEDKKPSNGDAPSPKAPVTQAITKPKDEPELVMVETKKS